MKHRTLWLSVMVAILLVSAMPGFAQSQPSGQMPMGTPGGQQPPSQQPIMGMMGQGQMPMMMCPMMGDLGMTGGPMIGMGGNQDPKAMGRLLEMRGEMMKAMGDILQKHGKAMQQGQ